MSKEAIERALKASLTLMLGFSSVDLILFIFIETAVLTVLAHAMSLWILVRYRLNFDFVKLLETSAFFTDLYLVSTNGYAVFSPFASLISIIIISYKKEYHMNKLKVDLEKILSTKKQDLEND